MLVFFKDKDYSVHLCIISFIKLILLIFLIYDILKQILSPNSKNIGGCKMHLRKMHIWIKMMINAIPAQRKIFQILKG